MDDDLRESETSTNGEGSTTNLATQGQVSAHLSASIRSSASSRPTVPALNNVSIKSPESVKQSAIFNPIVTSAKNSESSARNNTVLVKEDDVVRLDSLIPKDERYSSNDLVVGSTATEGATKDGSYIVKKAPSSGSSSRFKKVSVKNGLVDALLENEETRGSERAINSAGVSHSSNMGIPFSVGSKTSTSLYDPPDVIISPSYRKGSDSMRTSNSRDMPAPAEGSTYLQIDRQSVNKDSNGESSYRQSSTPQLNKRSTSEGQSTQTDKPKPKLKSSTDLLKSIFRPEITYEGLCDHYRCWMVVLMVAALAFILGHSLHDVLLSLLFGAPHYCDRL